MKTFHKILIALNLALAIALALFAVSLFDQREIFKERMLTLEDHAKTMSTTLGWGEFEDRGDPARAERFGGWQAELEAEAEQMRAKIQHHDQMHQGLAQLNKVAADRFATMIALKQGWDATERELGATDQALAASRVELETLQQQHTIALRAHDDTKAELGEVKRGVVALQGELLDRDQQLADYEDQFAEQQVAIAQRDLELDACNTEWQHEKEQRFICCDGPKVETPDKLEGKVVAMDSEMNFVVINVGAQKHVKKNGTALIHRDGQLVGKIAISRVSDGTSIGQILNDWTIENMAIQNGDEVLF